MALIVGILYVAVLSLAVTYAIGGLGLGMAIFLLLIYMVSSELIKARRSEGDHENPHRPHFPAHGGQS